jgi:hypothetical protein
MHCTYPGKSTLHASRTQSADSICCWRLSVCRAAALAGSGNVYLGVNLEFSGTPLNQSVGCGEQILQHAQWGAYVTST